MIGNRGAKGSIKDRLVSMLYRLRYQRKKQREEDYTVIKKEKKLDYINNLTEFKEIEDVNILDKTDKNVLKNVKYNAKFSVKKTPIHGNKTTVIRSNNKEIKSKYTTIVSNKAINNDIIVTKTNIIKKVGYVEEPLKHIDINLKEIENKNEELGEPVNLKKEEKKTKNQIAIIKEVDIFIKKSIENLDDINNEVETIKTDLRQKKDIDKLEERYNKLKLKIDKLKKQYDTVKEKYDLSDFAIMGGIKLIESIDNYNNIANLNEIETMVNVCKKEIEKIESITILNYKSKNVSSNIESRKQEENSIKIKFNKHKERTKEINTLEEKIASEVKEQEQIANEMYNDAIYFEKKVNKEIEYIGHKKILSSILNIAGGILTLPLTGMNLFGIAVGSTMINKGLKEINKKLETREKIVISYDYKDISDHIANMKDKVSYTNLILIDSLTEIKKLKSNFENNFKDYEYILPDYYKTLEKIRALENGLINQQRKLSKVDKKLEEEKDLNNKKLIRVRQNEKF